MYVLSRRVFGHSIGRGDLQGHRLKAGLPAYGLYEVSPKKADESKTPTGVETSGTSIETHHSRISEPKQLTPGYRGKGPMRSNVTCAIKPERAPTATRMMSPLTLNGIDLNI